MGQLLHGSATTTEVVRRAIQNSQESIAKLAKRYNLPAAGRSVACPRSKGACLLQAGKPVKKKFKKYPIGYVHIDIAEVQTEQGKLPAAGRTATCNSLWLLTAPVSWPTPNYTRIKRR